MVSLGKLNQLNHAETLPTPCSRVGCWWQNRQIKSSMSYYHVRLTLKSNPSKPESELDLSLKELSERFVLKYENGAPIVIAGRTVPPEDIRRIRISKSEEDSSALNDALRRQNRRRNVSMSIDQRGRISPVILAGLGDDVTARFISAPPGGDTRTFAQTTRVNRPPADVREVFVVHGRNTAARNALFEFLRAIDLHPLEWSEAVSGTGKASPYIGEILDVAFFRAHAVVVLMTPDDEARLKEQFWSANELSHETELTGQARPNVLFEAGMAMGREQDRTVLVELGTLRPFSDIGGRHVIRLNDTSQSRQELAHRLRDAGCPANLDGTDWHGAGDFSGAIESLGQESPDVVSDASEELVNNERTSLSKEAKELLSRAARNDDGYIMTFGGSSGRILRVGNQDFGDLGDPRSKAHWEHVLNELRNCGLVKGPALRSRRIDLTHKGYLIADQFDKPE